MNPGSTSLHGRPGVSGSLGTNQHESELGPESLPVVQKKQASSMSSSNGQQQQQHKLANSGVFITLADDLDSEAGSSFTGNGPKRISKPMCLDDDVLASHLSRDVVNGRQRNQSENVTFISEPKVTQSPMPTKIRPDSRPVSTAPKAAGSGGTEARSVCGATAKLPTHKRKISLIMSPKTADDQSVRRRKLQQEQAKGLVSMPVAPLTAETVTKNLSPRQKSSYGRGHSASSSEQVYSLFGRLPPYNAVEDTDSSSGIIHQEVDGGELPQPHPEKRSSIPFEEKYFEQLVLTAQKQMREYQEYMVQGILDYEQIACKRAPGPELKMQSESPFAALKAQTTDKETCVLKVKDPYCSGGHPSNKAKSSQSINMVITELVSDINGLPRYKSIGRLGQTPLARNVTIGKYLPYFPEDEMLPEDLRESKYQELRDRYKAFEDFRSVFQAQRDCVELCAMWRPFVVDIMEGLNIDRVAIVSFFKTEQSLEDYPSGMGDSALAACLGAQTSICAKCGLSSRSRWKFEEVWERTKSACDVSPQTLPPVGLLCAAFLKVTGLLLWHVIYEDDSLRESLLRLHREKNQRITRFHGNTGVTEALYVPGWKEEPNKPSASIQFCLVCGLAHCPSHGHFLEEEDYDSDEDDEPDDEEDRAGKKLVLLNDPEDSQNIHAMVSLPIARSDRNEERHVCGVYCLEDADEDGLELRGLQENGRISGKFRSDMERSRSLFDPQEICSLGCFWDVRQRKSDYRTPAGAVPKLDLCPDQLLAFNKCLEICLGNERGPCIMRGFVPGVRCVDLFHMMLQKMRAVQHQAPPRALQTPATKNSHGSRKWKGKRKGREEMTKLEDRPVFVPCNHPGPCQDNNKCSCFRAKIECEWMCGCDVGCERRFPGCSCHTGTQQVCVEGSCECWTRSRECDPWLCGSCGVVEVLDQANKYKEEIRKHRCMNNRIQLGLPARTIKAPSEVQGFGLFAGEDIPRNRFIGEYKGEVTSREECNRRGSAYHLSGMEYLFNLNQDQEVDASNFGNKTRFMNNSSNEQNINVVGSTMLCNGVQRVMLCAKRDIKAGEELLFDYKYPEHVRENFWERGEGDASKNAIALAPGGKRSTSKSETEQAKNSKGKGRARKIGTDQEGSSDSDSDSARGIDYMKCRQQRRARRKILDDDDDDDDEAQEHEEAFIESEFDPMAKQAARKWHRFEQADQEQENEEEEDEAEWRGSSGRDQSIANSVVSNESAESDESAT